MNCSFCANAGVFPLSRIDLKKAAMPMKIMKTPLMINTHAVTMDSQKDQPNGSDSVGPRNVLPNREQPTMMRIPEGHHGNVC